MLSVKMVDDEVGKRRSTQGGERRAGYRMLSSCYEKYIVEAHGLLELEIVMIGSSLRKLMCSTLYTVNSSDKVIL